jgi:hypothetical protein
MVPLIQAMNKPKPLNRVRVGVIDEASINAANAGGGEFYVTRGLLERANDEQLLGVLAHEVAHDDLGHVAKVQTLGAGLTLGMILLDQIVPGSGAIVMSLGSGSGHEPLNWGLRPSEPARLLSAREWPGSVEQAKGRGPDPLARFMREE